MMSFELVSMLFEMQLRRDFGHELLKRKRLDFFREQLKFDRWLISFVSVVCIFIRLFVAELRFLPFLCV